MKKIFNLLFLGIMVLGLSNVMADAGAPMISSYDIIVSNKDGASCYSYNVDTRKYVKSDKKLDYGKTYKVYSEIFGGYVGINDDNCDYVKLSDVKTTKESYSVNNDDVEKITQQKAVILARGGLNMRKGPAVAYQAITTIPQYSVVTLKYKTGTFWYYAEYNGRSGWISGVNQYFGYDGDKILVSTEKTEIYDVKDKDKVIGTIPPLTEITDYLEVVFYHADDSNIYEFSYYVVYNGIKGFVKYMPSKAEGKISLLKDSNLYDLNNKLIKTIKKGTVLEYSIYDYGMYSDDPVSIYIPKEKGKIKYEFNTSAHEYFEEIGESKQLTKTKGFIGEGLFGEKTTTNNIPSNNEPQNNSEPSNTLEPTSQNNETNNGLGLSNELIIICVLGSIVLALTIVIVILLVNKNKVVKKNDEIKIIKKSIEEDKKEIEKGENNEESHN